MGQGQSFQVGTEVKRSNSENIIKGTVAFISYPLTLVPQRR